MKSKKGKIINKAIVFWVLFVFSVYGLLIPGYTQAQQRMVKVPAGEFIMGIDSNDIKDITRNIGGQKGELMGALPRHKVNLKTFYIDQFEVTNNEYKKFIDASAHRPPEDWEGGSIPAKKGDHPVTFVTYGDAEAFCQWAGKRLPTEAEWERAARGTDGRYFPWGNSYKMRKYANTNKERKRGTTKVGSFARGGSPVGCVDMAGNVSEWTSSFYTAYPDSTYEDEFYGNERRVVRGGSWDDPVNYSTTVIRVKLSPASYDELTGFRCVADEGSKAAAAAASAPVAKAPGSSRLSRRKRQPGRGRRRKKRTRTGRGSAASAGLSYGEMVSIPAGEFSMGLDDKDLPRIVDDLGGMVKYHFNATPRHTVNLPAFSIDKTEVTNGEYKKFMDAAGHAPPEEGWEDGNYPAKAGNKPVVFVNWNDAQAFCQWKGKRLPTEAEWEKAARGTDGRLFPWGDKFGGKRAVTNKARKSAPMDIGKARGGESPYGCVDMAGNVWEWTANFYQAYPGNSHYDEFYGEERHVLRGGSFLDFPYDVLTTVRSKFTPISTDENVGFRCAK